MNIYALLTYPQPIVDLDGLDRSSSGFEYTTIRMTYQWTILILITSLYVQWFISYDYCYILLSKTNNCHRVLTRTCRWLKERGNKATASGDIDDHDMLGASARQGGAHMNNYTHNLISIINREVSWG
jgi:hypothetical protein